MATSTALLTGSAHADGVNWEAIAQCESGGNWAANTGNGDYGGLQISLRTWDANGGAALSPLPSTATPQEQVLVAQRIMATQGPGAWPRCASCSQDEAPVGSLTHLLTFMSRQTGGCRGSSRAVEDGIA
ncbi:transglycosylase family protein [Mycobacterium noviomagense]|uniref:Resuscitation-promoting factor RpfD n=1 Tax=Mycobacterium noviomagense TaxID=459858 RepID=A0ABX3TBM4_9MYCO|nr:transglycosylase family protein [Mycobacterium noviomagense]ORB18868.1 Resuscitation-promoting factor RpfD [Mycobacterium noviomagense]